MITMLQQLKSDIKNHPFIAGLVSLVMVLTLVGLGVLIYSLLKDDLDPEDISEKEKNRILYEVARNNPQGLISGESGADQEHENSLPGGIDRELARIPAQTPDPTVGSKIPVPNVSKNIGDNFTTDIFVPNLDKYNYRETTVTIETGPAIDSCRAYGGNARINNIKEQYFEYFDTNRAFYKNVSFDRDNDLTSYSLGKYGSDVNEYYNYIGGKITGKLLFKIDKNFTNTYFPDSYPESMPNSYPESFPGEVIMNNRYFGQDEKITDVYEEDGTVYYEITAKVDFDCYAESGDPLFQDIYAVYEVNGDNYRVEVVRYYSGVVDENNLIYTNRTKISTDKTNLAKIVKTFTYSEKGTPVVVDYRNFKFDAAKQAIKSADYLKKIDVSPIYANSSKIDLNHIGGQRFPERVKNEQYYYRKDYYPATSKGLLLYQAQMDYLDSRPVVEEWMYDTSIKKYIDVEIHTGKTLETIKQKLIDDFSDKAKVYKEKTKLNINGMKMNADYVAMEYTQWYGMYPDSYPDSYPSSYPESYPDNGNKYRVAKEMYIFNYDGEVYVISVYVGGDNYHTLEDRGFTISDIATQAGYTKAKLALLKLYGDDDGWYYCGC